MRHSAMQRTGVSVKCNAMWRESLSRLVSPLVYKFHSKIHKFTLFSRKIYKFSFLLWIASAFATPRNDGKFFSKIQNYNNFHTFSSNFRSVQTDKKLFQRRKLCFQNTI